MAVELGVARHGARPYRTYVRSATLVRSTAMLLSGINHVAVLTKDTDRFHAFYRDVFDADRVRRPDDQRRRAGGPALVRDHRAAHRAQRVRAPRQRRGRRHTPDVRPRPHRPHGAAGRVAGGVRRDPPAADRARLPPTASSPTSASPSASSSSTPTGSRARCVLDTPGTGPADLKPPGTPAAGYERVLPERVSRTTTTATSRRAGASPATTTRSRSGTSRDGDTLYLLAGAGEQSDWVRNLQADPTVTRAHRRRDATTRAVASSPTPTRTARARTLVFDKYQPRNDGELVTWRERALPVALDLVTS